MSIDGDLIVKIEPVTLGWKELVVTAPAPELILWVTVTTGVLFTISVESVNQSLVLLVPITAAFKWP